MLWYCWRAGGLCDFMAHVHVRLFACFRGGCRVCRQARRRGQCARPGGRQTWRPAPPGGGPHAGSWRARLAGNLPLMPYRMRRLPHRGSAAAQTAFMWRRFLQVPGGSPCGDRCGDDEAPCRPAWSLRFVGPAAAGVAAVEATNFTAAAAAAAAAVVLVAATSAAAGVAVVVSAAVALSLP